MFVAHLCPRARCPRLGQRRALRSAGSTPGSATGTCLPTFRKCRSPWWHDADSALHGCRAADTWERRHTHLISIYIVPSYSGCKTRTDCLCFGEFTVQTDLRTSCSTMSSQCRESIVLKRLSDTMQSCNTHVRRVIIQSQGFIYTSANSNMICQKLKIFDFSSSF